MPGSSTVRSRDLGRCHQCGRASLTPEAISIEVTRWVAPAWTHADSLVLKFCGQQHAGVYLYNVELPTPAALSWWSRAALVASAALVAVILGLALVAVVSFLR